MRTMKKGISVFLLAILSCLALAMPVFAQGDLLIDEAMVLTSEEADAVWEELSNVSQRQNCSVAIVAVESLGGETAQGLADSYFSGGGYGDAVLLLLSIQDRDWHISTGGFGITAFTDAGQRYIMDQVGAYLQNGDYYGAFSNFAQVCDALLTQANEGRPYDVGGSGRNGWSFGGLVLCLLIGAAISLLVMLIMKSSMKTVSMERAAASYVRPGSFKVSDRQDTFLYKNTTKTERQGNSGGSTTHADASGGKRGGSGGKF